MTGITRKLFSRDFDCFLYCRNLCRIDRDRSKWSLWHSLIFIVPFMFLTIRGLFNLSIINLFFCAKAMSMNMSITLLSNSIFTDTPSYMTTFFTLIFNHTSLNCFPILLISLYCYAFPCTGHAAFSSLFAANALFLSWGMLLSFPLYLGSFISPQSAHSVFLYLPTL